MRRRKSDRQYVWEYLRRNRIVKIEELLTVVDMSEESLRKYFAQLENAGYVKARKVRGKVPRRFRERSYGLVKNTGIIAPVWVAKQNRLFDRNLREMQLRESTVKLPIEVHKIVELRPVSETEYAAGRLRRLLDEEPRMETEELRRRSGLSDALFQAGLEKLKQEDRVHLGAGPVQYDGEASA